MKKKIFVLIGFTTVILLAGCRKTCVCYGYDGGEYRYSADEVDNRDVTCANMIFQAGQQYYSVCNWE